MRTLILLIASMLALASCAVETEPGTTTTTTGQTTTTTEPPTTTTSPTTTTTAPTTTTTAPIEPVVSPGFPGTGPPAFLTDVAVEPAEPETSIVFTFENQVDPEYRVEYVEPPILEQPSGRELEVAGEAYLSVTMAPASGVDLSGEEPRVTYEGPERFTPEETELVTEVVQAEDFESVTNWVVGLEEPVPFQVERLDDPNRLVIQLGTAQASALLVTWETADGSTFRAVVEDPESIERIRQAGVGGTAGVPIGRLAEGTGVNVGHDWHLEGVEVVDVTIEVCDGTASMVDENLDYWLNTVQRFCPWENEIVEIQPYREEG